MPLGMFGPFGVFLDWPFWSGTFLGDPLCCLCFVFDFLIDYSLVCS